jgi:hypothetical protein
LSENSDYAKYQAIRKISATKNKVANDLGFLRFSLAAYKFE